MVNTIPLILASFAHATQTVLGAPLHEDETRRWIGRTLKDTFSQFQPEHARALHDEYTAWNLAHLDELVEPYAGLEQLLLDLRAAGHLTGIVTSKRRVSAERTLEAVGLTGVIDILTTMEDTDRHKPAADPLLHALGELDRESAELVYVGDAVVDVLCARAAGADAIAVTWGAGLRPALEAASPRAIVEEMDALRALLLG